MSDQHASPPEPGVWFITGCSSGFGRELAELLLERGHQVAITAREPGGLRALADRHPQRSLLLLLDVTREEQRTQAIAAALAHFGRIDVLVNNAGRGLQGAVEQSTDEEVRSTFELNFFSLVALSRQVLPAMRRQGRGHIVNISSIAGLVGLGGSAFYAASKFAVEGFSQALAQEVKPFGIRVTVVEPGPFRTRFADALMRGSVVGYEATVGKRMKNTVDNSGKQAGDPRRAAAAIVAAVEAPHPPLNLPLGRAAVAMARDNAHRLLDEIAKWEELSLGTDAPPGPAPQN